MHILCGRFILGFNLWRKIFSWRQHAEKRLTNTELEKGRVTLAQNEDANTEPLSVAIFAEDVLKPSYFFSKVREYHSPWRLGAWCSEIKIRTLVTKATSLWAFKYVAGLIRPSCIEATNSSPSNNLNKVPLRELQKIFLPLNGEWWPADQPTQEQL